MTKTIKRTERDIFALKLVNKLREWHADIVDGTLYVSQMHDMQLMYTEMEDIFEFSPRVDDEGKINWYSDRIFNEESDAYGSPKQRKKRDKEYFDEHGIHLYDECKDADKD